MEEAELFRQERISSNIRRASLIEGIDAFQSGNFTSDCPYDHTKPRPRVYDINKPNVYIEESEILRGFTYRWELPPIEYEKAEAWKRGWLLAYWYENMEKRKAYIEKVKESIDYLKSWEPKCRASLKLIDKGFSKHFFNHFINIKKLKHLKKEFYSSAKYGFLYNLHIEGRIETSGKVEWFDAFLNITRKYERELGIEAAQEYLLRLNEDVEEVEAVRRYYEHERHSEKYNLEI
jgi:hypothetical protein